MREFEQMKRRGEADSPAVNLLFQTASKKRNFISHPDARQDRL
jgi:hypothetical protein